MTFIEAALEILDREGRPMHAREIADKAVELELLSHVGKTPVQTMSARISAAVAKSEGEGPFVRIRPGVFALSKWGDTPPGPLVPSGGSMANNRSRKRSDSQVAEKKGAGTVGTMDKKAPGRGRHAERQMSKRNLQPKNKISRSRERKSGETAPLKKNGVGEPQPETAKQGTPSHVDSGGSDRRQEVRTSTRHVKESSHRSKTQRTSDTPRSVAEATGDFAHMVSHLLRQHNHPLSESQIAEKLRLKSKHSPLLVDALLSAERATSEQNGRRPKFVKHKSGWALCEREVAGEVLALENHIAESLERLATVAERQVARKIRQLPMERLVQTVIRFLHLNGFSVIKPVERGVVAFNEFHLCVTDQRHSTRFNTAVVIRKDTDNTPLGDRIVANLRGSLHHYDAMQGLIITTGGVSEEALKEASISNVAPVGIMDGETLAGEFVRLGIGVKQRKADIVTFDESRF